MAFPNIYTDACHIEYACPNLTGRRIFSAITAQLLSAPVFIVIVSGSL